MSVPECGYLYADGRHCCSPAVRNRRYCFLHQYAASRARRRARSLESGKSIDLDLPFLDSSEAIQVAVMQVSNSLLDGHIDEKRARLLFTALHLAAGNLKHFLTHPCDLVDAEEVAAEWADPPKKPAASAAAPADDTNEAKSS